MGARAKYKARSAESVAGGGKTCDVEVVEIGDNFLDCLLRHHGKASKQTPSAAHDRIAIEYDCHMDVTW